ncbi:hypothetical protein BJX70DRAFT_355723 [Aspergillus crustosus]
MLVWFFSLSHLPLSLRHTRLHTLALYLIIAWNWPVHSFHLLIVGIHQICTPNLFLFFVKAKSHRPRRTPSQAYQPTSLINPVNHPTPSTQITPLPPQITIDHTNHYINTYTKMALTNEVIILIVIVGCIVTVLLGYSIHSLATNGFQGLGEPAEMGSEQKQYMRELRLKQMAWMAREAGHGQGHGGGKEYRDTRRVDVESVAGSGVYSRAE